MSAAHQLRLELGPERTIVPLEIDLADSVIAAYGGDARRAVRELLLDSDYLRDQLNNASQLMTQGYSREWKPRYERLT